MICHITNNVTDAVDIVRLPVRTPLAGTKEIQRSW
jgi:hypothetical protein